MALPFGLRVEKLAASLGGKAGADFKALPRTQQRVLLQVYRDLPDGKGRRGEISTPSGTGPRRKH